MIKAQITGTGSYAPPKIMTNDDLSKIIETSDEWIQSRTGIKKRHLVENGLGVADMAEHAARQALEASGAHVDEIDMIVFGTFTPDYQAPSAACVLQAKLGAKKAFAFDVSAACAGSLYALTIAERFIASGAAKKVLVVGAEAMSTVLNWNDRDTCVLFGDAAGVAVLESSKNNQSGFIDLKLYSDGNHWDKLYVKAGGSKYPLTPELLEQKANKLWMNGKETYKLAVTSLTNASQSILAKNNLTVDDISHVVAHQANVRIIDAVADRVGLARDKFIINLDRYANTSAASLMATLDEGVRTRFKSGDNVLMLAVGAGFAWGAGIYRV